MAVYTKENAGPIAGKVPPHMKGRYVERIKKATAKKSKGSGNKMIEWQTEIVSPQTEEVNGQVYDLTGLGNTYYLMCTVDTKDAKKNGIAKTIDLLERCGLKAEVDLDKFDSPDGCKELVEGHEGTFLESLLSAYEDVATKQDPNDPNKRIPILDGEGKEIKRGWVISNQLSNILGKSDFKMDQPY